MILYTRARMLLVLSSDVRKKRKPERNEIKVENGIILVNISLTFFESTVYYFILISWRYL